MLVWAPESRHGWEEKYEDLDMASDVGNDQSIQVLEDDFKPNHPNPLSTIDDGSKLCSLKVMNSYSATSDFWKDTFHLDQPE